MAESVARRHGSWNAAAAAAGAAGVERRRRPACLAAQRSRGSSWIHVEFLRRACRPPGLCRSGPGSSGRRNAGHIGAGMQLLQVRAADLRPWRVEQLRLHAARC